MPIFLACVEVIVIHNELEKCKYTTTFWYTKNYNDHTKTSSFQFFTFKVEEITEDMNEKGKQERMPVINSIYLPIFLAKNDEWVTKQYSIYQN